MAVFLYKIPYEYVVFLPNFSKNRNYSVKKHLDVSINSTQVDFFRAY